MAVLEWNKAMGSVTKPFIIGVAGGTGSGKSTVCQKIVQQLQEDLQQRVLVICANDFYRDLSAEDIDHVSKGEFNFDHPDAFYFPAMFETLQNLKAGRAIRLPKYDFVTHSRQDMEEVDVKSIDIVFFEGILALYWRELRDFFDMKLFVEVDPDTRLSRRVTRDVKELGRQLDFILDQYVTFVKPAFDEFCLPTKNYADVIIPRGADNYVAIDLIAQNLKDILCPPSSLVMPTTAATLTRNLSEGRIRPH